jgi:CubicO group peptidase (beta-lactamase class C family)
MTRSKLFALALAAATALPLLMTSDAALARSPQSDTQADFKAAADAIVAASYPADGPGAAVIVTRRGRVIYAAGRGLADVEKGLPITTDTRFRLGSIVKQFTAALVLKLVAEGKMSLDDPVSRFFPDYPPPAARATVRQLLNHTSGIQDFSKIPRWINRNRTRAWTTQQLLDVMRALPAKAEPGMAWEYNNGGYVLLGAIIEQVAGNAWHQAMDERIMRPLGLRSIAHATPEQLDASVARGYSIQGGRQQPIQLSHMTVAHAAGGLHGSVADMARWAHALHHGKVVRADLYKAMTSPARLANGTTETYGFGLRLRQIRGRPALVHGGAGGGLDTDSAYIPSEDLFVAVFANSDDPQTDTQSVVRRLAALALGQPIPTFVRAEIDIASLEPLAGLYSTGGGKPLRIFTRAGKFYVGRGDDETELLPVGEDRFVLASDELTWLRFKRRPDGAHALEIHSPDMAVPQRGARTGPIPPDAQVSVPAAVLQSYVGTYSTDAGPTAIVALAADGWLTIQLNSPPLRMRPISQTEFMVDAVKSRVIFHAEGGKVDRFTVRRGAREITGTRIRQ